MKAKAHGCVAACDNQYIGLAGFLDPERSCEVGKNIRCGTSCREDCAGAAEDLACSSCGVWVRAE
jgi:hypothetical protein